VFLFPTNGQIISRFGDPRDGGARSHEGIDIGAPQGTPIYAAAAGRVTASGWLGSNPGNGVKIDHGNGYLTKYFHASALHVRAGQTVSAGQTIASVGKTGNAATTPPHLHFEIWYNGRALNPVQYLTGSGPSVALGSAPALNFSDLGGVPSAYIALFGFALLAVLVSR
jgi:murein DD-endopeptidase MepM/ murein hydrolase activator NlpD